MVLTDRVYSRSGQLYERTLQLVRRLVVGLVGGWSNSTISDASVCLRQQWRNAFRSICVAWRLQVNYDQILTSKMITTSRGVKDSAANGTSVYTDDCWV